MNKKALITVLLAFTAFAVKKMQGTLGLYEKKAIRFCTAGDGTETTKTTKRRSSVYTSALC